MSPIASTNSAYSAVASLLNNTAPSGTPGNLPIGAAPSSARALGNGPADRLNLSDHAKAVLARAQTEQVAADKLQNFLRSSRTSNGSGNSSGSSQASEHGTQIFDQLTGQKQSRQGGSTWDADSYIDNPGDYLQLQQAAHTRVDGSIDSWSASATNVFNVPSTPRDIDQWYQTQGKQLLESAQAFPDSLPGLAEAIQNRTLTFTAASDVPGLNFHNSFTYQGGEGGSSNSSRTSFNSSLPIFQDPNVHQIIMNDGTVLSWSTPAAR